MKKILALMGAVLLLSVSARAAGGVRALGSADGKGDRDRAVCQKRARKAGTGQRH